MATYIVTFRIDSSPSTPTYSERYTSFCEAVKKGSTGWWGEPTSFYAVTVNETIDVFCSRIYVESSFNATKDLYMVLDANNLSGRVRGKMSDQDLFKVLPFVKKL